MKSDWHWDCNNFFQVSTEKEGMHDEYLPSAVNMSKTPKIKILKNENICHRYHHFTCVYQKSQLSDIWFLRYLGQQTKFFVILDHFLPFFTLTTQKIKKFEKMKKNSRRYYHLTHVYHKWQSYDVCFLRFALLPP